MENVQYRRSTKANVDSLANQAEQQAKLINIKRRKCK